MSKAKEIADTDEKTLVIRATQRIQRQRLESIRKIGEKRFRHSVIPILHEEGLTNAGNLIEMGTSKDDNERRLYEEVIKLLKKKPKFNALSMSAMCVLTTILPTEAKPVPTRNARRRRRDRKSHQHHHIHH